MLSWEHVKSCWVSVKSNFEHEMLIWEHNITRLDHVIIKSSLEPVKSTWERSKLRFDHVKSRGDMSSQAVNMSRKTKKCPIEIRACHHIKLSWELFMSRLAYVK